MSRTSLPWWVAVTAVLSGCAAYGRPLPDIADEVNATLYLGPTLVEPGDSLSVRVPKNPVWDIMVRVRSDGRATFPVIGEMRVAGRTLAEVKRALEEGLAPEIEGGVDVVVNLDEQATQNGQGRGEFVVHGEVVIPGAVRANGERVTLIEALGLAGGALKATALLGNTLLVRRSAKTGQYLAWHIDARPEYWGTGDPIYLQRHDMIFVPNTPINDANIWVDQYINQMLPDQITGFLLGIVVGNNN